MCPARGTSGRHASAEEFWEESTLEDRPLIAITLGDPAGVGPEIIILTFHDHSVYDLSCPFGCGYASF